MNEQGIGNVLKVVGAIAIVVALSRACGSREGAYRPPDPMDYETMAEYRRDKIQYDEDYRQARDDYHAERIQDNNW
jgi:hypothetical protein